MSGMGILATADRIFRFPALASVLAICLFALMPACASAACTVHGNVYDWSTFDTVNNAIVDVYSVPDLTLINHAVARSGSYSFSLPQGTYMIMATAGAPGTADEITATENVTVPADGERIIDLILFPADSIDDLTGYVDNNATPTMPPGDGPTLQPVPTVVPDGDNWILYMGAGAIVLAFIAIAAGILFLRRARPGHPSKAHPAENARSGPVKSPGPVQPVSPPDEQIPEPQAQPVQPLEQQIPEQPPQPQQQPQQQPLPQPQPTARDLLLPQDCREVLALIDKNGGRITQLDLRKALPYSEAKVSLIVSDLESRGIIKKIKKGRGNVLILNRPGEGPPEK